jgi:bifunctional non-homologous end joining protein LigD
VLRLPAASSIQQPSQLGTLRIGLILFDEEIALFRHATLADSVSGVSSLLGCYSSRQAFTRNGYNWVERFSVIAGAFNIPGQTIVDGEVVVIHEERTNFSELQADLGRGDQDRLIYFAFDLLWLDGQDLRRMSQLARKGLLKELIDGNKLREPIFYSEHHEGDGQELFEAASRLNYEGIVSKRVDAPYRSDRVEAWHKIKTVQREKFPENLRV